jgi:hypothetical protein
MGIMKSLASLLEIALQEEGRIRPRRALRTNALSAVAVKSNEVHPNAREQSRCSAQTVRVLFNGLPVVLVESGQVCRTGWPVAGVPVHRGFAQHGHAGETGQSRGSLPALSLPHDPELNRHLPENLNPAYPIGQHQIDAGAPRGVMPRHVSAKWSTGASRTYAFLPIDLAPAAQVWPGRNGTSRACKCRALGRCRWGVSAHMTCSIEASGDDGNPSASPSNPFGG